MVSRDIHFEQIAGVLGISMEQLEDLNPQYRRDIVCGRSGLTSLRLPAPLISTFIDKEDSVYAYDAKDFKPKRTEVEVAGGSDNYTVKKNKVSLSAALPESSLVAQDVKDKAEASRRDDSSVSDDDDDNGTVTRSSRRTTSRKSSRSSSKSSSSKKRKSSKKSSKKEETTKSVSVKSGDTLSEIAERNNTTVAKLKKLNNISGSNIRAGKKIRVK